MSINRLIARLLTHMPQKLIWIVSKKYIAGPTLNDAVKLVIELNEKNILSTIDVLGESVDDHDQELAYQQMYLDTISAAKENGLQTTFSLKPTMFGLKTDMDHCYKLVREIIEKASENGYFVRVDMEDSSCTDDELKLFTDLYNEFPAHVGIVLQAYLKRTISDISYLSAISKKKHPVNIRLCKGIYVEPEEIAYRRGKEVNQNFIESLRLIIHEGLYPAIATHHKHLIAASLNMIDEYGLKPQKYEFQMLYGVTPQRGAQIVGAGHRLRIYVPYGEQWFRYSMRRLQENPKMIWDVAKGIILRK